MAPTTTAVAPVVPAPAAPPRSMDRRSGPTDRMALVWKILLSAGAIALGLAMIFPIVWMVLTAFKPDAEAVDPTLWPQHFTWENFANVWTQIPFARLYGNTIVFAGAVTLISLAFDSMAAYALARMEFRGRNVVFIAILVLLMIPFPTIVIPLYDQMSSLGLAGTVAGMVIPRMSNAFGIFFMRQFFLSLPKDLEEAARIDGAGEWRIYLRIIMPLAVPALLTLGLFHFQYNWNDLLWPLVMSPDIAHSTLPAGLSLFAGQHVVQYGLLMAGSILALAPVIVFFLIIQRSFVTGIATTGMK